MQRLKSLHIMGLLMFVVTVSTYAARPTDNPPAFKPWLACKFENGLRVKEVRRYRLATDFRTVKTADGEKRISIVDGYTILFAFEKVPYVFANVKVEQSNPEHYETDKTFVIDAVKYMPSYKNVVAKMVDRGPLEINGFEIYGADREVIDKGEVLSVHVTFSNPEHFIVTIYFLNQGRERRRFTTMGEFETLRDNFLDRYTRCVTEAKSH